MAIRDTSAQDQALNIGRRSYVKRWLMPASIAVLIVGILAWIGIAWSQGSRSFDVKRLRIAQVTRGSLVRDIAADGRVIAANSPILYAISAGTVDLKVVAGDKVKEGQELATIDSPELRSKLAQEQATLAGLEAETARVALEAEQARAEASKIISQAEVERQAAARDAERYERGYRGGAVPLIDMQRAKDNLEKSEIELANARTDAKLRGRAASLDARNKRLLL